MGCEVLGVRTRLSQDWGKAPFDTWGDLFVGPGMRALEVSAEFHGVAVERCVGTHKCARVYMRAFAHKCALEVSVGVYLCPLVPKHMSVQVTAPHVA